MSLRCRALLGAIFGLLLTSAALAKDEATGHQSVSFDPAAYEQQRSAIERDIRKGDRYAEIGDQRRRKVLDNLKEIGRLLEDVTVLEDLKPEEKAQLFNLQEEVNTLLTGAAEDSRLICKRERKTGSHRQTTQCRTVATIRRERENWHEVLRDSQRNKLPEAG